MSYIRFLDNQPTNQPVLLWDVVLQNATSPRMRQGYERLCIASVAYMGMPMLGGDVEPLLASHNSSCPDIGLAYGGFDSFLKLGAAMHEVKKVVGFERQERNIWYLRLAGMTADGDTVCSTFRTKTDTVTTFRGKAHKMIRMARVVQFGYFLQIPLYSQRGEPHPFGYNFFSDEFARLCTSVKFCVKPFRCHTLATAVFGQECDEVYRAVRVAASSTTIPSSATPSRKLFTVFQAQMSAQDRGLSYFFLHFLICTCFLI
jgi:hypothetical protein